MKGAPTPPNQASGPFPLESNLRRLKPSLARLGPLIAGVSILASQGEFWDAIRKWIGTTEGWVVLGLLIAVALFFFADLFLKQIWFNERGIGVAMPFGGSKTWYAFDTLKGGQFKMKRRRRSATMAYTPTGRLSLNFHTGSVRLWPSLYDNKRMNDLLAVLSRRFPNQFQAPPSPPEEQQDKTKQPSSETPKETGKKASDPFPSLKKRGRSKDPYNTGQSPASTKKPASPPKKPQSVKKSQAERSLEQLLNRRRK